MADPLEQTAAQFPQYAAMAGQVTLQGAQALGSGIESAGQSLGSIPERQQQLQQAQQQTQQQGEQSDINIQRGQLEIAREEVGLRHFEAKLEGQAKIMMLETQGLQLQLQRREVMLRSAEIDRQLSEMEKFRQAGEIAGMVVPTGDGKFLIFNTYDRNGQGEIDTVGKNHPRVRASLDKERKAQQGEALDRAEQVSDLMKQPPGKGSGKKAMSNADLHRILSVDSGDQFDEEDRKTARGELRRRLHGGGKAAGESKNSGIEALTLYQQDDRNETRIRLLEQRQGRSIRDDIATTFDTQRRGDPNYEYSDEALLHQIVQELFNRSFGVTPGGGPNPK